MTDGVLIIDKPREMTSHDVVDAVRKRFPGKVGHLGTLDPAATGVLPLILGKATRLSQFFPTSPKEYTGVIQLGSTTTTGDAEGEIEGEVLSVDVGRESLLEAMKALTGRMEQIPPAYSAKKIAGVPAYRLARRGVSPQLRPIEVEIKEFVLTSFETSQVSFRVVCYGGTYIRSLARDLGESLGTGGHLSSLRRTHSGPFDISQCQTLEYASAEDIIPLEQLIDHLERIEVDEVAVSRIRHGSRIECHEDVSTIRIFNKKSRLIAVATVEKGWAHPKVVLL